ncbi:hypothetical protein ACOSP7_003739 [Xanthoceras sorbifolium]
MGGIYENENRNAGVSGKIEHNGKTLGVGSANTSSEKFTKTIRDIKNLYKFSVFAILEPRTSGRKARNMIKILGFTDHYVVEAEGFAGGLWLLWGNSRIRIQVITSTKYTIAALVDDGNCLWIFTTVYASTSMSMRKQL